MSCLLAFKGSEFKLLCVKSGFPSKPIVILNMAMCSFVKVNLDFFCYLNSVHDTLKHKTIYFFNVVRILVTKLQHVTETNRILKSFNLSAASSAVRNSGCFLPIW